MLLWPFVCYFVSFNTPKSPCAARTTGRRDAQYPKKTIEAGPHTEGTADRKDDHRSKRGSHRQVCVGNGGRRIIDPLQEGTMRAGGSNLAICRALSFILFYRWASFPTVHRWYAGRPPRCAPRSKPFSKSKKSNLQALSQLRIGRECVKSDRVLPPPTTVALAFGHVADGPTIDSPRYRSRSFVKPTLPPKTARNRG